MERSTLKGNHSVKAYSQDLRERILRRVDEGKPQVEVGKLFEVSESTVRRYVRQRREKGHVRPKPIPGRHPTKRASFASKLQPQLEKEPDATLQEHCNWWEAESGICVSYFHNEPGYRAIGVDTQKKSAPSKRAKRRRTTAVGRTSKKP